MIQSILAGSILMFSNRDAPMKNTDWVYGAHSRSGNVAIVDFLRARESFSPYGDGRLASRSTTKNATTPYRRSPQPLRRDSGFDEPREFPTEDICSRSMCRMKDIESSLVGNGVPSRKLFAQSVKSYRETEYLLPNYDKIFAATWLSDKEIILGTKCNNVLLLNTETGTRIEIPSPRTQTSPPVTTSRALVSSFANLNLDASNSDSQDDESADEPSDPPAASVSIPSLSAYNHCSGIHSIEINPSRTMVAVGAGEPTEFIQVYDLPSFRPLAVLRGHTDMVFSIEWVNDTTLVSGSRDTTVKLFSIDRDALVLTHDWDNTFAPSPPYRVPSVPSTISPGRPSYLQQLHPLPQPAIPHRVSVKHHSSKVRDLRMDPLRSQFLTLSTDGTIALWDARECRVVQSSPLIYSSETVCVGLDAETHIYAIGSQSHVSFYDPRVGGSAGEGIVHVCDSLDEGWGVRCVKFRDGVAVIGGGLGRLSFYDMRMRGYLEWTPFSTESKTVQTKTVGGIASEQRDATGSSGIVEPVRQRVPRPTNYLNTGHGWLLRDPLYQSHFNGTDIRNAIYAIAFEEDLVRAGTRRGGAGARLAVAGGPLQLNLCGSYCGLF